MTKPFLERPLSWSSVSQWEYSKEDWFKKYILNERQAETAPLIFGKKIGEKLATDFTFLPEVPRLPIFEQKLVGKIGDIPLIGFLDAFQQNPMMFHEFKTSSNKLRWSQDKAESHGQMDFYYLLLWLNFQTPPEKIRSKLVYIPCRESGSFDVELSGEPVQIFEVKKTTKDIIKFGAYLKQIYREMQEYIKEHDLVTA